ncbi:MAG: hypothetical protein ABR920_00085 [Terriglobales bacterium]
MERQVKFWRTLTVLSLMLCAAGVVTHLEANPNWIKTTRVDATAVVAREFDLVNTSGRVTARLASDPDNPDSPNLVFKYPNDKGAVLIGVDDKTGSSISVFSSNGQPRATMKESANGPAITLFDEGDKLRVAVLARGEATQIAIYDKDTKRIWVVPTN